MNHAFWRDLWVVAAKEITDALRDRRTLLRLILPTLCMGPLMLLALSSLIASLEERADKREVMVVGMANAPTLRNYIERQTYTIVPAPADYEAQLRERSLSNPVLVVGEAFELELLHGELPTVQVVSDSANQRARSAEGSVHQLLTGFNQERAALRLALLGVSGEVLQAVEVQELDLASTQAKASNFTSILPMFIIMAVLYGALTSALDSTAGERERGSLEPLLMNPSQHLAVVLGKWCAVTVLGMLMASLSSASFVPAQWLIKSDSLQAMFQFGWSEALAFVMLMLPLAMGGGALLMAVAIRSKTFKEAQASSGLVLAAMTMTPMITIFNPGGDAWWYTWLPGLGQNTLMLLVLKGEQVSWQQLLPSLVVGVVLTGACLLFVARSMRAAVAR
jgi:sodium transport system permease protein